MQEYGFLGVSKNSRKNHIKSTHPEGPRARSGARGQPVEPQAPCWRGPTPGRAGRPPGWVLPPMVPYQGPYLFPSRGNPRTEVVFPVSVVEPPPPSVLHEPQNTICRLF